MASDPADKTAGTTPTPDGPVTVFTVSLEQPPAEVILDAGEQQRANRFAFEDDRRRFIAAHTALRVVLGRALQADPRDLQFALEPQGKPRLAATSTNLRFNLSHSGERALIALTSGREVGVDIERVRPMSDMGQVAARVFSRRELAHYEQLPPAEQPAVFFRLWTRKESFIKARGDGMHFPLKGFTVSAEPALPQLLLECDAAPDDMTRWTMLTVPCDAGYAAAITVEGQGCTVVAGEYR